MSATSSWTRHAWGRAASTAWRLVLLLLCSSCVNRCGADSGTTGAAISADAPANANPSLLSGRSASAPAQGGAVEAGAQTRNSPIEDAGESCPDGMVRIEGGKLSARRKVPAVIRTMCVDRTEVTVQSYAECVAKGACQAPTTGDACNWSVPGRELHPMNCIDLDGAEAYCKQHDARLPTHDEWEWAASGRAAATVYPWGNSPPSDRACWSGVVKRSSTCPVGTFPSGNSPEGISDLSGNVAEWTSTEFHRGSGTVIVRGGGWDDQQPEPLRTDTTDHQGRESPYRSIGFRCVIER